MAEKKTDFHKATIIGAVLAAVVGAVVPLFFPPAKAFFKHLWGYVLIGWDWFASEHLLYGWLIILMLLCCLAVAIFGAVCLREWLRGEPPEDPWYHEFTAFTFYDIAWRWQWAGDKVKGLRFSCPKCDAQLFYAPPRIGETQEITFYCKRCKHTVGHVPGSSLTDSARVIEREIYWRIRTKETVHVSQ